MSRYILLWLLLPALAVADPVDRCDQITGYQTSSPFSGNTLASFGNQYDLNTCSGMPAAPLLPASGQASDQVVKLRVAANCNLTVTEVGGFQGGNQSDPTIYLATTCPIADPGITNFLDASCLAAADATGGLGTETFTVPVQAGTDYYLYLDGFLAAQGPYEVTLSGCTLIGGSLPDLVFEDDFE